MVVFGYFEVVFCCTFSLNIFKTKVTPSVSKTGGGVKATFGQCPKVNSFFLGMPFQRKAKPDQKQPNIALIAY